MMKKFKKVRELKSKIKNVKELNLRSRDENVVKEKINEIVDEDSGFVSFRRNQFDLSSPAAERNELMPNEQVRRVGEESAEPSGLYADSISSQERLRYEAARREQIVGELTLASARGVQLGKGILESNRSAGIAASGQAGLDRSEVVVVGKDRQYQNFEEVGQGRAKRRQELF